MTGGSKDGVQTVRDLYERGTAVGLSDGELLERFATRRDENAFATLVERHGPMVLRACRSQLVDHHAALDAFQGTFLVLARKADGLWVRDSVGPWLHRVALRTSARAIRDMVRRQAAERRAVERTTPEETASSSLERDELAAAVHEELNRLPDAYRATIVLCDLEGLTCEQAAHRLGRPPGTVASRLSRGRDRLRERLRRRGFAPRSGALVGPGLALPAGLAESTASAAMQFLSTSAAPSSVAAILALGVVQTMTRQVWWKSAAVLLTLAASTSGVVAVAARGGAGSHVQQEPAALSPAPEPKATAEPGEAGRTVVVQPSSITGEIVAAGRLRAMAGVTISPPMSIAPVRIVSLLASGANVAKGDVVAELDSTALKEELGRVQEQLATTQATRRIARDEHEAVALELKEYENGGDPLEQAGVQGEIELADVEIEVAQGRLVRLIRLQDQLERLQEKPEQTLTRTELLADLDLQDRIASAEAELKKAEIARKQARAKLNALEQFARAKTLARLRLEVEKTRVVYEQRERERTQQLDAERTLKAQIAAHTVRSPIDGVVNFISGDVKIGKPGELFSQGLPLASIQAAGLMEILVRLDEHQASLVQEGQSVRIQITEAWADVPTVTAPIDSISTVWVTNLVPDGRRIALQFQVPESLQKILQNAPSDGLNVQAMIPVKTTASVLSVPTSALVWYDDAYNLAVERADGVIDWRVVAVGVSNPDDTEIRAGLAAGDVVIADPEPLLSEDQRRRMSISPAPTEPNASPEFSGGFE